MDLEDTITKLIHDKKGDHYRLEDLLTRIKSGKKIYNSDKMYLETLLDNPVKEKSVEIEEKPINLEELRKSQPTHKPQKAKPIKFAVSYSNSRNGSAKIHNSGCHNTRRSSQEGDIKWMYYTNYPSAKHTAQHIGTQQPFGWKHACCCMRSYPFDIILGCIITTLLFGILGGLVSWYFTRDHFGESWAKTWLVLGWIVSILLSVFVVINYVR